VQMELARQSRPAGRCRGEAAADVELEVRFHPKEKPAWWQDYSPERIKTDGEGRFRLVALFARLRVPPVRRQGRTAPVERARLRPGEGFGVTCRGSGRKNDAHRARRLRVNLAGKPRTRLLAPSSSACRSSQVETKDLGDVKGRLFQE